MQALVAGGDNTSTTSCIAALPSRNNAASPLDDRDKGKDVMRFEPRLDHEVDLAEGDQAIVIAVAAEAPEAHGPAQDLETPRIVVREQVWSGRGKECFAKSRASPRSHPDCRPVMAEESLLLTAEEAFAGERLIHHAEQGDAAMREPDQSPPQRLTHNKGAGPVDWVDDPAIICIATDRAEFLADDTVAGIAPGERVPDGGLRFAVGRGHGIKGIAP